MTENWKILAILSVALSASCGESSDIMLPPEGHTITPIGSEDFVDTVWYDSVDYGGSIFFDFKNMREGAGSKYSKNSDLESHFGGPITGCGSNEVHCMHGGFTFSIPKSAAVSAWSISGYDCTLDGNHLNGNVDCRGDDHEINYHFQYWLVNGNVNRFRLIVDGYDRDAFFYVARNSGMPIDVIKNF